MLSPIDRQGSLIERIDEATGNTIDYGAHNGFERSARKSVLHGIDHLAGIFCKGLELPSARQHGERAIDQVDSNQFGMMMLVAGGERLPYAGNIDGDRSLHFVFVLLMHSGAARSEEHTSELQSLM